MPAFNERETVADVIREVRNALPGASVLVVDDGSADTTARVARDAGATVLRLPFNVGVGGAMRLGFRYAVDSGYANVLQIDSDGQHDPQNAARLLEGLSDADIVVGARFAGQGEYDVRGPRRWAMRLFAAVLSRVTKAPLTDPTSGFKAMGPRAIGLFSRDYPAEYLGDTLEALVIAARAGLVVRQIPVAMRPRAGGNPSHNPLKAAIYLGRATVALLVALIRPRTHAEVTA